MSSIKEKIEQGKTSLGIELGSTRIKAVLIDEGANVLASGSFEWENRLENGIWTYSLEDIWRGLQKSYADLVAKVKENYGVGITRLGALGFSAMMHGYMAFDEAGELLVPFRTWRNVITGQAAKELTKVFQFNIPQRWSVAHLYQAILNGEEHVKNLAFFTTLSGYIHWKLTGQKVLGIGDASGMFPIDSDTNDYDAKMLDIFDVQVADKGYTWKIKELLPKVLSAGDSAGCLTKEGTKLLDPSGQLEAGVFMCPPEGDAGTGMVATNSVAKRTGNVSAGTSIFAMIVLERALTKVHEEIDMVTTPDGSGVAMVHANNGTSDLSAWVGLFKEFSESVGMQVDVNHLYEVLYKKALEADADAGGLLSYGYLSGEHITGISEGRPMFVRSPKSNFNLANFMRSHLFTALGAIKVGMDILIKEENVQIDSVLGHGGLFKTKGVGQKLLAGALNTPVSVMETAGEGGPWGMAILASYMVNKKEGESLSDYLNSTVFAEAKGESLEADAKDVEGFEAFMQRYKKGLAIEQAAIENLLV